DAPEPCAHCGSCSRVRGTCLLGWFDFVGVGPTVNPSACTRHAGRLQPTPDRRRRRSGGPYTRAVVGLAVHVLGQIEARRDGERVELGGPKQRGVLGLLALEPNRVVSVDRLVDALWRDEPPNSAEATVQSYVSRLRKALGADAIESAGAGY